MDPTRFWPARNTARLSYSAFLPPILIFLSLLLRPWVSTPSGVCPPLRGVYNRRRPTCQAGYRTAQSQPRKRFSDLRRSRNSVPFARLGEFYNVSRRFVDAPPTRSEAAPWSARSSAEEAIVSAQNQSITAATVCRRRPPPTLIEQGFASDKRLRKRRPRACLGALETDAEDALTAPQSRHADVARKRPFISSLWQFCIARRAKRLTRTPNPR